MTPTSAPSGLKLTEAQVAEILAKMKAGLCMDGPVTILINQERLISKCDICFQPSSLSGNDRSVSCIGLASLRDSAPPPIAPFTLFLFGLPLALVGVPTYLYSLRKDRVALGVASIVIGAIGFALFVSAIIVEIVYGEFG